MLLLIISRGKAATCHHTINQTPTHVKSHHIDSGGGGGGESKNTDNKISTRIKDQLLSPLVQRLYGIPWLHPNIWVVWRHSASSLNYQVQLSSFGLVPLSDRGMDGLISSLKWWSRAA